MRLFAPLAAVAMLIAPNAVLASVKRADVLATATRLADWQLANMNDGTLIGKNREETLDPLAWQKGTFWAGMTALADTTKSPRLTQAVLDMGKSTRWHPGPRATHADDHMIAQSYLWAAKRGAGATAIVPTRRKFDEVLAAPPRVSLAFYQGAGKLSGECLTRWCWCDALFMAPPAWIEMSRQTGDRRYRDYALKEFRATTDFLFDPAEHLFYRDSRFFERRDDHGNKMFWSRGNGWVMGGLAHTIPLLPKGDPDRARMEKLFRDMAGRLKTLQKADGYWAPSLLSPEGSPPEASGTGFYVFAFAWGIKVGLLDRATYEPSVRRGWAALEGALQPDGRLGYVQQVSDRPEAVKASDTQFYGTGAFLLAAAAIADLDLQ